LDDDDVNVMCGVFGEKKVGTEQDGNGMKCSEFWGGEKRDRFVAKLTPESVFTLWSAF
jgi:hypothetical protein